MRPWRRAGSSGRSGGCRGPRREFERLEEGVEKHKVCKERKAKRTGRKKEREKESSRQNSPSNHGAPSPPPRAPRRAGSAGPAGAVPRGSGAGKEEGERERVFFFLPFFVPSIVVFPLPLEQALSLPPSFAFLCILSRSSSGSHTSRSILSTDTKQDSGEVSKLKVCLLFFLFFAASSSSSSSKKHSIELQLKNAKLQSSPLCRSPGAGEGMTRVCPSLRRFGELKRVTGATRERTKALLCS